MKLSSSLEKYLKTIYILQNTEKEIRVTDIARKMQCTKPSVNKALKGLKELGFVNYEAYGDITLTNKGNNKSKEIVKRFSTLKLFLTEILEIDKQTAEYEAEVMKHAISEDTSKKLENYINKVLDLGNLDCDYDEKSEKCRRCVKITAKNRIKSENNK